MQIQTKWLHDHLQEFRIVSHPTLGDQHAQLLIEMIRYKVWFSEGERCAVAMADLIESAYHKHWHNPELLESLDRLI